MMVKKHYDTDYEEKQKHMRRTASLENHPVVKGYDFSEEFDFNSFLKSYSTTGFQASNLARAVDAVNEMIHGKATIFFSFTGNAVSSGLRDIIAYLAKNKLVGVIITSASGVEEDVIKSLSDFRLGDFDVPGRALFEYGVGRIGNIFVPNDRYLYFEKFIKPFLEEMHSLQEKNGKPLSPSIIARELGLRLKEDSYLYWAAKNKIPVYCPGIMDGSFGDLTYFFKQRKPSFRIDVTDDHKELIDFVLQQEKTGLIVLGGGIAKHYALNAQIFREGFDHAVYLTTAEEFDGSDSGGSVEEAKTWAKIKIKSSSVKVKADFTITFPLLVAGSFAGKKRK